MTTSLSMAVSSIISALHGDRLEIADLLSSRSYSLQPSPRIARQLRWRRFARALFFVAACFDSRRPGLRLATSPISDSLIISARPKRLACKRPDFTIT
jgi:hypothetical protein